MYKSITKHGILEVHLAGTLTNVDRADKDTRAFLDHAGVKKDRFRILLLIREALNNAIGVIAKDKPGPLRNIRYFLEISGDQLLIEVEDDGDGFDWKNQMEQSIRPKACNGRGIAIMKKYAAHMCYNEKGNLLKLVIDLF